MTLTEDIKQQLRLKLQSLGFIFETEQAYSDFSKRRIGAVYSLFDENIYQIFLDDSIPLFTVNKLTNKIIATI